MADEKSLAPSRKVSAGGIGGVVLGIPIGQPVGGLVAGLFKLQSPESFEVISSVVNIESAFASLTAVIIAFVASYWVSDPK